MGWRRTVKTYNRSKCIEKINTKQMSSTKENKRHFYDEYLSQVTKTQFKRWNHLFGWLIQNEWNWKRAILKEPQMNKKKADFVCRSWGTDTMKYFIQFNQHEYFNGRNRPIVTYTLRKWSLCFWTHTHTHWRLFFCNYLLTSIYI